MTVLKINVESPEMAAIIIGIHEELRKAEKKHPDWPVGNIFEQVAIITEEAGEIAKAVLDHKSGYVSQKEIRTELMQTAAMCIRMIKNLDATINE